MLGCLVILLVTFFLLTVYNILQDNVVLLPDQATRFFIFKIMDTSSTASLFVTLLGALLVRHQFALGLLPRIIYKSGNFIRKDLTDPAIPIETWRVQVLNSGLGAAIVTNTNYVLELLDTKASYSNSYQDIVKEFDKIGLVYSNDYWLENITNGFALSPKDDCFVFEIKREHLVKIRRLDLILNFKGQLGHKFQQRIVFTPQKSIGN